jgi:hypothetical protein
MDRPHGGASKLCRYSDEPFNANEIIWPHWGMVPAILATATFAVAVWAAWPKRNASPLRERAHRLALGREAALWRHLQRKRPALREAFLILKA